MKKKTPEQEVLTMANEIGQTIANWEGHCVNGCNDPSWSDGVNMNLLRNHVIYYKRKIVEICEQHNIDLPPEYFLPEPPYVDSNFFAKPDSERAIRILSRGRNANIEKITSKPIIGKQLVLF